MKKYIEVLFTEEKPENGWILTPVGGWIYENGIIKCPYSGVRQQGINSWLKIIKQ